EEDGSGTDREARSAVRAFDSRGRGSPDGTESRGDVAADTTTARDRDRSFQGCLQQSWRDRAQLAAEELQGQRQQAAGIDEYSGESGVSFFAPLPRTEAAVRRQLGLLHAEGRRGRPGRHVRILGWAYQRPESVPLSEEQLSLARHDGGAAGR